MPWLVQQLNLSPSLTPLQQIEPWQAQLMTAKAAQDELDSLLKSGVLPKSIYEEMRSSYQVQIAKAEKYLRDFYNHPSDSESSTSKHTKLDAIRRRLLLAEKNALDEARRKGILSDNIVRERLRNIDQQLLDLEDD